MAEEIEVKKSRGRPKKVDVAVEVPVKVSDVEVKEQLGEKADTKPLITKEQLKKVFPLSNKIDVYIDFLNEFLAWYEINTPKRIAHFLSQVGHESAQLNVNVENLNYSADRLAVIFPRYFGNETKLQYARRPEKIANRVYANRMGNGPESSGDGWKYRGRGLIQTTGRNNYEKFKEETGIDVIEDPDFLLTPKGSVWSACLYWHRNGLNALADRDDVVAMTKAINGGQNGIQERLSMLSHTKEILNC